MKRTRVAINGFGRIGRSAMRAWLSEGALPDVEIVAINDLGAIDQMAHLLKYDSIHGRFPHPISAGEGRLLVGGREIAYVSEPEPEKLPWKSLGIDIVLECTGRMLKKELASKHLTAGAKRVLLSAPPKEAGIPTIVLGVNETSFNPKKDLIVSNASCTTNCLAPLALALDEEFGIERGLMVTVHSYTNDQNLHDSPHKKDWRRARAGAISMIPTTTGAARAVGEVLPHLKGKLSGYAVRVPTPAVSLTDLTVELKKNTDREAINARMKHWAEGRLKGILSWTDEPLVSIDLRGDPHSCIFDSRCTQTVGERMAKVVAWYDNEMGYSHRLIELAAYIGRHVE
ncbi:MAG: type I glyceraldehyde-3-phosphate dehydrogenase [Bdellovibrionota bacterium]